MAQSQEINKLRQHLTLLKQEYSNLQAKYTNLERKYSNITAENGENSDTFASNLLRTINKLYNSEMYSDIKIRLTDRIINAHKLVLSARSDLWAESIAANSKNELDWSEIDVEVAEKILQWLYTNDIQLINDELTLKIIRKAHEFKLSSLVERCETILVNHVDVQNCVKFYSVAEEISAINLREYCSGLISAHWNDLMPADFESMSAPLLYEMLKNKTQLPLHSAVRLQREDVVFICLVDNSSKLSDIVNVWGPNEELPLDIALRTQNAMLASTLVQHNADINIRDSQGETLLHRSIKKEDSFAVLFLLENNCDVTLTTRIENESPLHLIAGANNIEDCVKIAQKLINKNVNVNAQNRQGHTALHISIIANNYPIFELLLQQQNLQVNLKNSLEHTPLYYALLKYESGIRDEKSYVNLLIEKDAQTNPIYSSNCDNLLQVLLCEGAEDSCLYLTDLIQDINHANVNGESALHTACNSRSFKVTEKLLNLNANPNLLTNETRRSPLHFAVSSNSSDCIEIFIKYNESIDSTRVPANFNVRDSNGDTPLSLALNQGYNQLVPILIEGKADVNVRNGKDFTLLHEAILKEDSTTAIFLLDNGADINAKTSDYETPLQLAIHCRLGDVVDSLCIRGVDMSAPDRLGNCALWAALDSGQDGIASILVRHGADTDCWNSGPDNCQQTLLHRAIDENKEAAAIFLIQAGCDLNSPRMPGPNGEGGDEAKDRASPLHLCCQWGLQAIVQTLIEHGAKVNSQDALNKTPLHYAIENQHHGIISLLLSVPEIDLSLRDKSGLSPFATALTYRNIKAAQSILDKMPSAAEQFDAKGQNFLHTAIKKGDVESVMFLVSVNVDLNSRVQDSSMTTPLQLAVKNCDETIIRSLILAGARIEDRDAHKQTAIHIAAEAGNPQAVNALLNYNCDYDALDVNGDNALHIAVREGHYNVVKTLLTESKINAGAVNLKGRNPLHELCRYGKENAAAIFELFLESMPNYTINTPDLEGNTPLLLAYMKGNGNLCRALVKAKASLAAENQNRVTIFNYQVATKQLLFKLLDQLSSQGEWTTTDLCQECGKNFTMTMRKHHCRHCGRALCSKCSDQEVPIIKFGENKPVRVCKVCFDVLKSGSS